MRASVGTGLKGEDGKDTCLGTGKTWEEGEFLEITELELHPLAAFHATSFQHNAHFVDLAFCGFAADAAETDDRVLRGDAHRGTEGQQLWEAPIAAPPHPKREPRESEGTESRPILEEVTRMHWTCAGPTRGWWLAVANLGREVGMLRQLLLKDSEVALQALSTALHGHVHMAVPRVYAYSAVVLLCTLALRGVCCCPEAVRGRHEEPNLGSWFGGVGPEPHDAAVLARVHHEFAPQRRL